MCLFTILQERIFAFLQGHRFAFRGMLPCCFAEVWRLAGTRGSVPGHFPFSEGRSQFPLYATKAAIAHEHHMAR